MRKNILLILLILSGSILVNSQINNYLPEVISPTPQASMFNKYINHKVNLYNGIPEITIPLGEIALDGLTIPIVLSYHASGIKYLSFDGEVGAGWSLNIGNYRISRTINGKCDFEVPKRFDENEYNKLSHEDEYGAELYRWGMYYFKNSRGNDQSFKETIDYNVDPEYDFFTFNIPTRSGKFLLLEDPDNKYQSKLGTPIGESNNEIINISPDEASIKDDLGNYFQFGRIPGPNGGFITEKYRDMSTFQLDKYQTVGWPLTSISSSLTGYANLFYKEYTQFNTRHSHQKYWSFSIHNAPAVGTPDNESVSTEASFSSETVPHSLYNWDYKVYSLDRIESNHMDVFIHRIDAEQPGNTPSLIRSIDFKDKSGRLLKTVDFKYNFDEPSTDKKLFLHYMLESVTIDYKNNSPEKYSFDYYESSYKRSKGSGPDLWGFYINPGMNISNDNRYGSTDIYIDKSYKEDEYYDWYSHSSEGFYFFSRLHTRKLKELPNKFLDDYRIAFTDRSTNNNPYVFSLKRITYPAGGHTEYEYEPHGEGMGGMRIKRIKSVSADDTPDFISTYEYGQGIENFRVDRHSYKDSKVSFGSYKVFGSHYYSSFRTIDTYSTNIRDYIPLSDYSVSYKKVTEKNEIYKDNTTESNGSRVYEYTIPQVYNISYLPEEIIRSAPWEYKYNTLKRGVYEYRTGYSPTLKSKQSFSKDNELIQAEYYDYIDSHPKNKQNILSLSAIKLDRVISTPGYGFENDREKYKKGGSIVWNGSGLNILPLDIICDYSYFRSFFGKMVYSINLGGKTLLKNKTLISYNKGSSPIVKKENYDYDDLDRLTKVTFTNSDGNEISEENFYPTKAHSKAFDYKNMKSVVIKTQTKINGKLTKEVEKIYPVDDKDYYELMLPIKIVTRNTDESTPETEVSIKYADHNKAKIEQYTGKDGETVTYLWSYNGRYPIAEIRNARYEDVVSAVKTVFKTDIYGVSKLSTVTLNQLINLQTNPLLRNAMISLYTYKPHIGMETYTNPSGITTYYDLDSSGRLLDVKNNEGKIISEYSYKYRDRQESNIKIELSQINLPHIGVNDLNIHPGQSQEYSYYWIIRDISANIIASGNTSKINYSFKPGQYCIDYSLTQKSTGNIISDTKKIEVKNLSADWKNKSEPKFAGPVYFSCLGIGGSGKYQYNWSIKNKQGNIINSLSGSRNSYEYNIPEGEFTVDCKVTDLITNEKINLASHKLNVKPAHMELKHEWYMTTNKGLTNGIAKFMIGVTGGGGYNYYSYSWRISGEGISYDTGENDIEAYLRLPSKSGYYSIECTVKDALYNNEQTFFYNIQVVDEIIQFSYMLNTTQKASARVEIKSLTDLRFSIGYSGDRIPNGSYANYRISHSNGNTLVNKRITSSDFSGPDIVLKNIPSGTLYIEMEPDYQRYLEIECSIHMYLLDLTSEKIIGSPSSLYYPKEP